MSEALENDHYVILCAFVGNPLLSVQLQPVMDSRLRGMTISAFNSP